MTELSSLNLPNGVKALPKDEFLQDLSWLAVKHNEILADVVKTFQHNERNIKVVYGLDFDVIYTYANPWDREANHSNLVNYILEKNAVPMTLLPGTVCEYRRYINKLKEQDEQVESMLAYLNEKNLNIYDKTIDTVLKICNVQNKSQLTAQIRQLMKVSLKDRLKEMTMEARMMNGFARMRLQGLLDNKMLIPLRDLYSKVPDEIWDDGIFNEVFSELAVIRKGEKFRYSNAYDALNLATVIKHSSLEGEICRSRRNYEGSILRLLTNTDSIMKMRLEKYKNSVGEQLIKQFHIVKSDIRHSFAVRSCFEAAYASVVSDYFQGERERTEAALEEYNSMNLIKYALVHVDLIAHQDAGRQDMLTEDGGKYISSAKWDVLKWKHVVDSGISRYMDLELREVPKSEELLGKCVRHFASSPILNGVMELLLSDSKENSMRRGFLDTAFMAGSQDAGFKTEQGESGFWWQEDRDSIIYYINQRYYSYSKSMLSKLEYVYDDQYVPDDESLNYSENRLSLMGVTMGDNLYNNGSKANFSIWLHNEFSKPSERIFNLEYTDDMYYVTWPLYFNTQFALIEVLSMLNRIFNSRTGILAGKRDFVGELFAVYSSTGEEVKLFDLPVKSRSKDVNDPVSTAFIASCLRGKTDIPSYFICDTEICTIRIDIIALGFVPGIIVTFYDESLMKDVLRIFKLTSYWGQQKEIYQHFEKLLLQRLGEFKKICSGEEYDNRNGTIQEMQK